MAVTEKKNIWLWSTSDGTPPPIRTYKMAGTQGVLMPGAPVELNSSGLLELSDTDDVTMLGYVMGVVDKSKAWPLTAALSANDEVRVMVVRAGDIYAVYCDNNDSDAAAAQNAPVVGTAYGMRVSSLSGAIGYVTLDINETSTTMFTVVDLASNVEPTKFTTSDSPGVVLVKHTGTLQG